MGGQTCTVCRNDFGETIDEALVAGEPLRNIAEQHGLSTTAIHRHKKGHLSATLVKAAEAQDLAHGARLLDRVNGLVDSALASLERAEGKGNEREVQGAIREARHSMELVGRITGEIHENNRENAAKTPLDAIMEMAATVSEAYLLAVAAGEDPEGLIIDGTGHVVNPE